jgi:hypothetical protein
LISNPKDIKISCNQEAHILHHISNLDMWAKFRDKFEDILKCENIHLIIQGYFKIVLSCGSGIQKEISGGKSRLVAL